MFFELSSHPLESRIDSNHAPEIAGRRGQYAALRALLRRLVPVQACSALHAHALITPRAGGATAAYVVTSLVRVTPLYLIREDMIEAALEKKILLNFASLGNSM
jgi:hypothetical protein